MLEALREKNSVPIYEASSPRFAIYGKVVEGYDFTEMIRYMNKKTTVPEEGNQYLASVPELEAMETAGRVQRGIYGGMPVQVGYCNGRNTTCNGFEYHKGSEINIAASDFMLILGHTWDIKNNSYHVDQSEVFLVRQGMAVEMYQTTLHLSPCTVSREGFRDIVILPGGTNTPLEYRPEAYTEEDRLLLMKNKWMLAHPDRELLILQGAHPGVLGENLELFYLESR